MFPPLRLPRLHYRASTPVIPALDYREKHGEKLWEKNGNKTAALAVLHVKPALKALRMAPAADFPNPVERTSCRQIFLPSRRAAMP
ncbi:hypothetical protein [Paraburkholderia sp. JHI869]|uniref:hypothetical protein n=1 Tax=Paraburkholderia sp. JHI869 TaxID=3112959 RepID=UPI003170420C